MAPVVLRVVHIAGVDVQIGALMRQRCSWCGAVLIDYDLTLVARGLEPGEDPANPKPWRPAAWPIGGLVAVDGGTKYTVDHTDGDVLPPDACSRMKPDAPLPVGSAAADRARESFGEAGMN